jgi:Uma2 family endonuclease
MGATTLISIAEYMDTSYSPDREYVDGVVMERNVGMRPHSRVLAQLICWFASTYPQFPVWPTQRLLTVAQRRCRVPDLCLTLEDPLTEVFEQPPFLCMEILSNEDSATILLEKLEEYATFGVPHIWIFDPRRKKAYSFQEGCLKDVHGEVIATSNPEIRLPLEEAFRGL